MNNSLFVDGLNRVGDTAAAFGWDQVAIRCSEGPRHEALLRLMAQAFPEQSQNIPVVDGEVDEHRVHLSSAAAPADGGGTPFVWQQEVSGSRVLVYPLADWSDEMIESYLGSDGEQRGVSKERIIKVAVLGNSDSGKSETIELLVGRSAEGEESVFRFYHANDKTFQFRETRGRHASDQTITAAAWDSDVALLTVCARRGLDESTRRLIFLLALAGVPRLIVGLTRLQGLSDPESRFEELLQDLNHLLTSTSRLSLVKVVPVSRDLLPWYEGESLPTVLDRLPVNPTDLVAPLRFAVHCSGAGQVRGHLISGEIRAGDEAVVLPSGAKVTVRKVTRLGRVVDGTLPGDALAVELAGEADIPTESLLVPAHSLPARGSDLDTTLCWLDRTPPLEPRSYYLYHNGRLVEAKLVQIHSTLVPDTYEWAEGDSVSPGQVVHASLTTGAPLYFETYLENRQLGRFVLLERETYRVVGVGILRGEKRKRHQVTDALERLKSEHVVIDPTKVSRKRRAAAYGHQGAVLWFTGLSGSGKSAAAKEAELLLFERGCRTIFLDGDNVRSGLNGDLGFTQEERSESNRRTAELAALLYEQGQIVICSFISGCQKDREFARSLVGSGFFLFFVDCPVEVCKERDPKGLYAKAEAGELLSFTGVSLPYERPQDAELVLRSDRESPEVLAAKVIKRLIDCSIIPA